MRMVRVLLADPFSVVRLGVRAIVRKERDFEVLEAANLRELQETVAAGPVADLALVDLDFPPAGALKALPLLRGADTDAVVWSRRARLSPEVVFEVVRAGAIGVLCKEMPPAGLVRALRGVARGEAPVPRELVSLLIEGMHAAAEGLRTRSQIGSLSVREREVLDLLSRGMSNREIAVVLGVSEFTAKRHVQNILRKLHVHSRSEASASYYAFLEQAQSPGNRSNLLGSGRA